MSCGYCKLKRREVDGAEFIAGEDWEDEDNDGGYIRPDKNGFSMLVYYDFRCAATSVDNIKFCPFCGDRLVAPKEPLIKDKRIRKAVRAWADASGIEKVLSYGDIFWIGFRSTNTESVWKFECNYIDGSEFQQDKEYTIAELCGEN